MNHRGGFRTIVLLLTLMVANRVHADGPAYTFSVNGETVQPVHYSLDADDSVFAPGDVIYLGDKRFNYGGLFMTLGDEKDCRFVTLRSETGSAEDSNSPPLPPVKDGRVFLELPDGQRKVVAVIVTVSVRRRPVDATAPAGKGRISFDETPVNPLDAMSPEEIHGLWGIYLNRWPEGIEQKLACVNTDRVCITITDSAGVGGKQSSFFGGPSFPPIPPKVRYLIVRESMSPGLRDFSRLSQFHDLTFLVFQSGGAREALDAGLISQNISLRYLDISRGYIENYPKLASLTELRFLNVSGRWNIDSIEFVKDMRRLKTLFMGRTKVASLSPLDDSDSIREVYAGMSEVHELPRGELRSLRALNLISTKVQPQTVAQFRKAHPACKAEYGWTDSLRSAVQGTTRLRVRSGGTCHRQPDREKTLIEIADVREIERVVKAIDIDERHSGGVCACCGEPTFEFYTGNRLLAMIGYHHGERLRWVDGSWTGDGELTGPGQEFLISWLAQHGVQGPRREREEQQRQSDQRMRRQQRYAELIPGETFAAVIQAQSSSEISWKDDTVGEKRKKLVADAFMKYEGDAQTSVALYLRILGVTREEPWNTYDYFDDIIVRHLLPRFKGPELAQAVVDVMKDDEGMMGAARWFLGENGWRDLDESDRARILSPLARQALQHHYMATRKRVMNTLSEINGAWAAELLRLVLSRPTDPSWTPRNAKYGWKIDLPGGDQVYADECSDAVWAAFCLAEMGDLRSLSAIERLAGEAQGRDKELLEKALKLLRDREGTAPEVIN